MKNKNSFVIFLLTCVTFISVSVFMTACNVGLGESVDTKPPTVEFTFPEASSVVRCASADKKILVVGGGVFR